MIEKKRNLTKTMDLQNKLLENQKESTENELKTLNKIYEEKKEEYFSINNSLTEKKNTLNEINQKYLATKQKRDEYNINLLNLSANNTALKKEYDNLGGENAYITKEKEKEIEYVQNSVILKEKEIKALENVMKGKFGIMCYSSKRYGYNPEIFNYNCGQYKPTIIVIKTTNDDIIGGYTTCEWKGEKEIRDDKSFLFNINRGIYKPKDLVMTISPSASSLPSFGPDLVINPDGTGMSSFPMRYEKFSNQQIFLEDKIFTITDLEIYQVTE